MKKKFRAPILVNLSLMTLLLISSSFTLTACQNLRFGPEAIKKEKEKKAVKADQKKQEQNKPTKSKSKPSEQTPGKDQDTQIDDDPE